MSEADERVRCVGCCNDIETAVGAAVCPHCARPIADSLRRWERFASRDESTVRGALLTIAIAAGVTIPISISTAVASGVVDAVAIQRHPMEAMMSSKAPLLMIPACGMLPVQFVMAIAWLLIFFFAFGGVIYRVIWPIAAAVGGYVAVMVGSVTAGIVLAVSSHGSQETAQALSGTLGLINAVASTLLLYVTLAWAIHALHRSFTPDVPGRLVLWSLALACAVTSSAGLAHAAWDQRPAFESGLGILRVIVLSLVYTLFTVVAIRQLLLLRRTAAELANRHRGLRVGAQPIIVNAAAPPMWQRPAQ